MYAVVRGTYFQNNGSFVWTSSLSFNSQNSIEIQQVASNGDFTKFVAAVSVSLEEGVVEGGYCFILLASCVILSGALNSSHVLL